MNHYHHHPHGQHIPIPSTCYDTPGALRGSIITVVIRQIQPFLGCRIRLLQVSVVFVLLHGCGKLAFKQAVNWFIVMLTGKLAKLLWFFIYFI